MNANRSILLIEDDAGIRESVADCLDSEGYAVISTSNGVEGLEWLRGGGRADLIVVDLVMPVMNGSQFLSVIRDDPALQRIPVVLMTAAMPTAGAPLPKANGYLPKPFELEDLLEAVKRYAAPAA